MRARNLKPGIFKNYELALMGSDACLLFMGLWCMADRKGRMKDEPEKIQAEIFPFRFQDVAVDSLLNALAAAEDPFIVRYQVKGVRYIEIKNFLRHQKPHPREQESTFPPSKNKDMPRREQGKAEDMSNRADVPLIPFSDSLLSESPLGTIAAQAPQTYPLPDPKANPKACLVLSFKTRKGIPFDDRGWDKSNFGRCMAAAGTLLGLCKTLAAAEACLNDMATEYDGKGLTWTLETIARNASEWLKKNGRIDADSSRAGLRMAIAERRAKANSAGALAEVSSGAVPVAVRNGPVASPGNKEDRR